MLFQSKVSILGHVARFPDYTGERVYMKPFTKKEGLPKELLRWTDLVNEMIAPVDTDAEMYLMIDQSIVKAGSYHRRPGRHIDGYWDRGGGGMHRGELDPSVGRWRSHIPVNPGGHSSRHSSGVDDWSKSTFEDKEGILLCSNVFASLAYSGPFKGPIGDGGDCSKVKSLDLTTHAMHEGYIYGGNVTMLHESIPVPYDCERTVVRINTPGWEP